jgi:formiminotetrahydrofolate cyclodeaminase
VEAAGPTRAAAGPVIAQAGAAAASIVSAAAREAGDGAVSAQAAALAARLERLAAEDADAFARARAALAAALQSTPSAKRDFELGRTLDRAAAIPLEMAEACADVATLARDLAERCDPSFAPDLEAAARLASGAARAAAHLVEVNLVIGREDERAARARAAAEAE